MFMADNARAAGGEVVLLADLGRFPSGRDDFRPNILAPDFSFSQSPFSHGTYCLFTGDPLAVSAHYLFDCRISLGLSLRLALTISLLQDVLAISFCLCLAVCPSGAEYTDSCQPFKPIFAIPRKSHSFVP
jgi:hypothetical protein